MKRTKAPTRRLTHRVVRPKETKMPPKKVEEREVATREEPAPTPKLVSLGGGPYALDAAGQMYRVDAGQETVETEDGPVTKNVAVLTRLDVRYA